MRYALVDMLPEVTLVQMHNIHHKYKGTHYCLLVNEFSNCSVA